MTALFSTSLSGPLVVGFLLGSGVTCVAIQAIAYGETRALRGVFLFTGPGKEGLCHVSFIISRSVRPAQNTHNETLSVAAMCVNSPDRLPVGINR
jgi:hypothetical protein